ncbi:MAG: rhodanese-like domain-containing protein [Steroidobacteraceae bacterium]
MFLVHVPAHVLAAARLGGYEATDIKEKVIVIDARSPQAYEAEHIPGAINIPHRQMNQQSTAHLDRSALVVTYCDGIGCNASTKGALAMSKLGFRVKELMGGLDWWKRDGHPTSSGISTAAGASGSCACT